jgi:hypothetical protein
MVLKALAIVAGIALLALYVHAIKNDWGVHNKDDDHE